MVIAKTKRVVIKEELVKLTGDYKLAIVLNQMIYWSERIADFEEFIKEEKMGACPGQQNQNGWIYKTASELAEECMMTNSEATMRRYLNKLVEQGWLDVRHNPNFRWDKTLQYRLHLKKVQMDLFQLGYMLEGYRLPINWDDLQNAQSNVQNESSKLHDERAITESTSESTSENVKEEEINPFQFFEQNGFGTLGGHISQKITAWCENLTDELVIKAMEMAVERGAKSFAYVETILRDWADKKVRSIPEVNALMLTYKESKFKQQSQRKHVRKELIPDYMKPANYPKNGEDNIKW
ncbi:MAG: DnaD domain protein [Niallia sp.]